MGTEVWTIAAGYKTLWDPVITAEQAESEGWDGLVATDSQSRRGDPYIALALAAKSSTRLLLATGVTNPVTRHPVITANCAATVQEISGGRMVLGIGRGDSALAYLGFAPASVGGFENYLRQVQGYLRGDDVPYTSATPTGAVLRPVDTLGMKTTVTASRLEWLNHEIPKVPVDVAASGPRVIALGAVVGDRVTFAVGANPRSRYMGDKNCARSSTASRTFRVRSWAWRLRHRRPS